ncbi:FMN-dependent dehydrogenase [Lecanosticta acicola]|uniref:L-lactate dehydrogenase (cytochrome) n=1 Tax=Lecanosticta acicola TaxID=111012 RepID=A0AAI8Z6Q7_9PEZI|nr:FMN-dependent dehydrogenase [Lecanosticta acicola]
MDIDQPSSSHLDIEPNNVCPKNNTKPPLSSILNSHDFQVVASRNLSRKTWAFYSSAATDLITRDANEQFFSRIWLRPRVMRNVENVTTRTRILGQEMDFPLFVSPAAMARLVHPEGEKAIARGCQTHNVGQCISSNASYHMSEIVASAPGSTFFFQLYVNKNRAASEALLKEAERAGVKAVFVTVDAPVAGKREADERTEDDNQDESLTFAPMSGAVASKDSKGAGIGRTMGSYIDASLNWSDLVWLRKATKLPIVLKGIGNAEDALLAASYGVDGIVVSNHGGRSLDTTSPAILTLLEMHRHCPKVFDRLEVYIDGGIRRGTDIFKALCLGAKAVGIARTFLYALQYGQEGVEHLISIMKDELETTMKLIGVTDISQLHPGMLNTRDIDHLVPTTPLSVERARL